MSRRDPLPHVRRALAPLALLLALAGPAGGADVVVHGWLDPGAEPPAALTGDLAGQPLPLRVAEQRSAAPLLTVLVLPGAAAGRVAALELLSERAERLVTVGPVAVVGLEGGSEPGAETRLAPTGVASEVRTALAGLAGEARRATASRGASASVVATALVETVAVAEAPGAILVVGDLPAPIDPAVSTQADPLAAAATALAAGGWAVLPLVPTTSEGSSAGAELLAGAGAGDIVADGAGLDAALGWLARPLRLVLAAPDDLEPGLATPLVASAPGLRLPGVVAAGASPLVAAARARRAWRAAEPIGPLGFAARWNPDPANPDQVQLGVLVETGGRPELAGPVDLRVTTLFVDGNGETTTVVDVYRGERPAGRGWLWRGLFAPQGGIREAAVGVEVLGTPLWGARPAAGEEAPLRVMGAVISRVADHLPKAPRDASGPAVVRLVPPVQRPLRGPVEVLAVATTPAVASVRFLVDDRDSGVDARPPFVGRVDLGSGGPHRLRAEARGADGTVLGEHAIEVNQPLRLFRIDLRVDAGDPARAVAEATVAVPPGATLDRVELFRGERRVASLPRGPYRVTLAGGVAPGGELVRAVAILADGRRDEAVALVGMPGAGEELEVNLVQIFATVTDGDGNLATGLAEKDLEVRLGGVPQPLVRFAPATEVPLHLAVVIDTSESMVPLMFSATRAATTFLGQVLRPGDRAAIVELSSEPRLRQALTGDLPRLLLGLGGLAPTGRTAMWDASLLATAELGGERGRKAIVLLTDGEDYGSRFGLNDAVRSARGLGVPVYVVSLAGLDPRRPNPRSPDIETLARETGGRVEYVRDLTALPQAYARIEEELRSQVLLAIQVARDLSGEEIASIEVAPARRGLRVRHVVGAQD